MFQLSTTNWERAINSSAAQFHFDTEWKLTSENSLAEVSVAIPVEV
jgi:hypothetical protein